MTPGASAPGLQAERTRLAWQRTALGLLGNGVLHLLGRTPTPLAPAVVTLSALLALAVVVVGQQRSRILLRRPQGQPPPLRAPVLVLGSGIVALGVLTGVGIVATWIG